VKQLAVVKVADVALRRSTVGGMMDA